MMERKRLWRDLIGAMSPERQERIAKETARLLVEMDPGMDPAMDPAMEPKVIDGRKYWPVYLNGELMGYAPEATHPSFSPGAAAGFYRPDTLNAGDRS